MSPNLTQGGFKLLLCEGASSHFPAGIISEPFLEGYWLDPALDELKARDGRVSQRGLPLIWLLAEREERKEGRFEMTSGAFRK